VISGGNIDLSKLIMAAEGQVPTLTFQAVRHDIPLQCLTIKCGELAASMTLAADNISLTALFRSVNIRPLSNQTRQE
jgi:hypothetical protein